MGKKLFIGLLILFAVLYFGVAGVGWFTADSDAEQRQRKQDPGAGEHPALRALDALLAPLAPPLALNGLQCAGQPVAKIFRLTAASPACTVRLCGACRLPDGEVEAAEHRRGELRVYDAGVRAFVFVDVPSEQRPQGCRDALPETGVRLTLTYTPDDGGDGDRVQCWLERDAAEPIALSVLQGGGTLALECLGCDQAKDQGIRLRIR